MEGQTRLEWMVATQLVHVRLPREDYRYLVAYGHQRGMKIGEMVRLAVREWVEERNGTI